MNNFRRSLEEIVQVVKIADTTLKKRLDEFKKTPSGELTVGDFRSVWLDAEVDPPAYTKGREKEEEERLAKESEEEPAKKRSSRKGKRKRLDSEEEDGRSSASVEPKPEPESEPDLLNTGILTGTTVTEPEKIPLFYPEPEDDMDSPIANDDVALPEMVPIEETASTAVAEEVSTYLNTEQGVQLTGALDEAEERRLAEIGVVDELTGLDEEELDRFILGEAEVKIKERVWVEMNREYLEALAGRPFPSFEHAVFAKRTGSSQRKGTNLRRKPRKVGK